MGTIVKLFQGIFPVNLSVYLSEELLNFPQTF
jgi:hypothetical protein